LPNPVLNSSGAGLLHCSNEIVYKFDSTCSILTAGYVHNALPGFFLPYPQHLPPCIARCLTLGFESVTSVCNLRYFSLEQNLLKCSCTISIMQLFRKRYRIACCVIVNHNCLLPLSKSYSDVVRPRSGAKKNFYHLRRTNVFIAIKL
jgi:hypothetical protein